MKTWDEKELEEFIRANKDKFDVYHPDPDHGQHFLKKLVRKFREVISIVPYLVKVGIATLFVFLISFLVWRAYICPPLSSISFKYWKVEHDYKNQIDQNIRLADRYILDTIEKAKFESDLQELDGTYKIIKEQLKENPTADNIARMLSFYKEKLLTLQGVTQNIRH
jgi:hypothetical protein